MSDRRDAIVIGAGHNGLVAALTLAAGGKKVLVLERAAEIGGLCAYREFHEGFRAPGLLQDTTTFRQELIEAFNLRSHGLELRDAEPPVFAADGNGDSVLVHRDPATAADALAAHSAADAAAYEEWRGFLDTIGAVVRRLLDSVPPPLKPDRLAEIRGLGLTALALRRLGRETMTETLRVLPMSAADWLQERFESELLCATLAAPAVLGTFNGPWSAGTTAQLIFQEVARGRTVAGGGAALVAALRSAAEAAGIEIRTSATVAGLEVEDHHIDGVLLESGEEIGTDMVLACCDPKQALLDFVDPRYLDVKTVHDLENFRCRGTTAILHLAVQGPVEVGSRPGEPIEHLRLGGATLDDIERAFDAAKYGERATKPHLEVRIPTVSQPDLAPEGAHVVTALVSCAPHDLNGGWDPAQREALIADCVRLLNEHIPGLREHLVNGELLAPPDLEAEYALPGGHLHHGEHAPDQLLFLRPTQYLSRYATPVHGLYLGASGSHPGGGITGMPGHLAARTALATE